MNEYHHFYCLASSSSSSSLLLSGEKDCFVLLNAFLWIFNFIQEICSQQFLTIEKHEFKSFIQTWTQHQKWLKLIPKGNSMLTTTFNKVQDSRREVLNIGTRKSRLIIKSNYKFIPIHVCNEIYWNIKIGTTNTWCTWWWWINLYIHQNIWLLFIMKLNVRRFCWRFTFGWNCGSECCCFKLDIDNEKKTKNMNKLSIQTLV